MYVNQFCLAMPHEWYIIPLEDSGIDQLSVAMKRWTGSASAYCGAKPWVKREPTSRIDSPESNQNAKCPLTVEIQLHRWAGTLFYSAAVLWGKTIGQHPQAVGDVCPLLVRQATLGRRQGDGIGGRLIRVKPGTCRGETPPSCCSRPFCRLQSPLGTALLRKREVI